MLDSNTNKTVWIGVAVGIVALLGVGTSALYPEAFENVKSQMVKVSDNFASSEILPTPKKEVTLSKANWNYIHWYDGLTYNFDDSSTIKASPSDWKTVTIKFSVDRDVDIAHVDINNYIEGVGWVGSNDNDYEPDRSYKWYDSRNNLISNNDVVRGKIKANKLYKVEVRWHNTSDKTVIDGSNIGFRPEGGVGALSDWPLNFKIYDFTVS